MPSTTRRQFLRGTVQAASGLAAARAFAPLPGERPAQASTVEVLNPRMRVPVSLIIDDSTCLVNLNRFAIPQFAAGQHYRGYFQDWRSMPPEIPDEFVRRFAEWCAAHGVKGKYSVAPFPACVGRLDRELPGWTSVELRDSIRLVRELITPNWDIHPEMVTHTRVIDIKTGHPYPYFGPEWIENWEWTTGRSTDEIAAYMRYALGILRNIELPCEGITTPGGFGQRALPELAQATLEACRDVCGAEIPHYFRHLFSEGEDSVAPRVEYASGLDGGDPRCVVSIIGCTGDWTGNWDCSRTPEPDRFITPELAGGRLVEVIGRGEPACLVCHWTGIHYNGRELGFQAFQEVVRRLHERYDNLIWMKLSEISRYWAARELTAIEAVEGGVRFRAPFACPAFTVRVGGPVSGAPALTLRGKRSGLTETAEPARLQAGGWMRDGDGAVACFDLPRGESLLAFGAA